MCLISSRNVSEILNYHTAPPGVEACVQARIHRA